MSKRDHSHIHSKLFLRDTDIMKVDDSFMNGLADGVSDDEVDYGKNKKQKLPQLQKTTTITMGSDDEQVKLIILDFSNSSSSLNEHCKQHVRKWEFVLKKKFSMQQEGKKKWLLNRELKYKHFFPVEFMNDKEFVLNHIKKYGYGLEYASTQLKQDPDFVLKMVQQQGIQIQFSSCVICGDKEVAFTAIKNNACGLLIYIPKQIALVGLKFKKSLSIGYNKEVMFEAVKNNGLALLYTHYSLQQELEMEALKCNGYVLEYSDELYRARMHYCYHDAYLGNDL
ncbi:hypothetical protein FDP41_009405 [Naegleria fowleri]|uniref:DUF4116 domain-containing protein n=1 Tax=Naegleria fowleri TaxID=5763 RepID=A0A6A5BC82_NAEFO|nr:uncharacterized protein FDP41_009405 [Naegleria fowleri]KAF0972502.1 hypothetical protein FDP41_009405 [Naegleria fowleri]